MSKSEAARVDTPTSPYPRRWRALALLGIAQLMLVLDITVVAIVYALILVFAFFAFGGSHFGM